MMLPSVPKSLGRLSDVFISALGSITGKHNRLGLPKVKSACVVLVDGLGSANLRYRAGHAPFLASQLNTDGSIMCGFPSTTVASLASFATGVKAGVHGMVGYQILDRSKSQMINLLTGIPTAEEALRWQAQTTVSELACESKVTCYFVGPAEYENSGFTNATMRAATYVPAKHLDERFAVAKKLLEAKGNALVYLYVPELDQSAHAYGFKSGQWVNKLEDLDSAMRKFSQELPQNCGVLLTADHGIVDVSHDRQIYLDEFEIPGLVAVGGDPRVLFLYLQEDSVAEAISLLSEHLLQRVIVASRAEVISAGWYGEVSDSSGQRMPDIFLISVGETALYHRDFAKPKSLQMIGQHGSISDDELFVPLLKFGNYRKAISS
jgi:predicted AlkP superfamily pyrophosphatase or phosphodiesterase